MTVDMTKTKKQNELEIFLKSLEKEGCKTVSRSEDKQQIRSRFSAIIPSSFIKQYKLESNDISIIILLFTGFLKGHDGIKSLELINSLNENGITALQWITKLLRLKNVNSELKFPKTPNEK